MDALTPLARSAAAALLAAAVLPGLAGCTFTNPQTTQKPYIPGDGQDVSLGVDIRVASLMVITEDEGQRGRLVARVVNATTEPATVTFTGEGLDESVEVPPQETVAVGDPQDPAALDVFIDSVAAAPGRLLPMTLSVEGGASRELGVPVLDGTLAQYQPYLPGAEGAAPLPQPTSSASSTSASNAP